MQKELQLESLGLLNGGQRVSESWEITTVSTFKTSPLLNELKESFFTNLANILTAPILFGNQKPKRIDFQLAQHLPLTICHGYKGSKRVKNQRLPAVGAVYIQYQSKQ